jgi:hypothetical protein
MAALLHHSFAGFQLLLLVAQLQVRQFTGFTSVLIQERKIRIISINNK